MDHQPCPLHRTASGWNGQERKILREPAFSPPILGVNRSLYRMLLENETSRAVRESGHIAHNADGVSLSRLTAAYLPSCRSASGHV